MHLQSNFKELIENGKSTSINVYADGEKYYTESAFYHALKKELIKMGYDVIKKLIQKDGHLMGDRYMYYIRERKWNWCLVDPHYAINDINKRFNEDRKVDMHFHIGENW